MIKVIKLVGGMDIITRIEDGNEKVWHFPFIIMSMPRGDGNMVHNLQILCTHNENMYAKVEINSTDAILLSFEPTEYFKGLYEQAAEKIRLQLAGIVPADKKQSRSIIL